MEPTSPNWVVFYLFEEAFGPLSIVADHAQQAVLRTLLTYLPASVSESHVMCLNHSGITSHGGVGQPREWFQFYDLIPEEVMGRSQFRSRRRIQGV